MFLLKSEWHLILKCFHVQIYFVSQNSLHSPVQILVDLILIYTAYLSAVGVDFTLTPNPDPVDSTVHLLFSPGDLRKCITVNATDDTLMEGREEIGLLVVTNTRRAGRLSILDNDSKSEQ